MVYNKTEHRKKNKSIQLNILAKVYREAKENRKIHIGKYKEK